MLSQKDSVSWQVSNKSIVYAAITIGPTGMIYVGGTVVGAGSSAFVTQFAPGTFSSFITVIVSGGNTNTAILIGTCSFYFTNLLTV